MSERGLVGTRGTKKDCRVLSKTVFKVCKNLFKSSNKPVIRLLSMVLILILIVRV